MAKKIEEQMYDHEFKVMLVGGAVDDKTMLVYRFVDEVFKTEFTVSTEGYVKFKTMVVDGTKVKLDIWDTAAQESYHTIAYYKNTKGIIVVYDVTNRESFEIAKKWIAIAEDRTPYALKMLIGNRCHAGEARVIMKEEGENLAKMHGMKFFETSAKHNTNIVEVFTTLAKDMKCQRERESTAACRSIPARRQATSPVAAFSRNTVFNMPKKTYDHLFKILLIGDADCGKTEILFRFCDDAFNSQFISTIGIDFKIKTVDIDGKRVKLQIWDTAGQERFHTITSSYYRGACGIMLVYDIRKPVTLTNMKKLIENIEQYASEEVLKFLLGNRCHLEEERAISKEQGENLARAHGMKFFETSAKHNINITEAFMTLARDLVCMQERKDREVQDGSTANTDTSDCTLL